MFCERKLPVFRHNSFFKWILNQAETICWEEKQQNWFQTEKKICQKCHFFSKRDKTIHGKQKLRSLFKDFFTKKDETFYFFQFFFSKSVERIIWNVYCLWSRSKLFSQFNLPLARLHKKQISTIFFLFLSLSWSDTCLILILFAPLDFTYFLLSQLFIHLLLPSCTSSLVEKPLTGED